MSLYAGWSEVLVRNGKSEWEIVDQSQPVVSIEHALLGAFTRRDEHFTRCSKWMEKDQRPRLFVIDIPNHLLPITGPSKLSNRSDRFLTAVQRRSSKNQWWNESDLRSILQNQSLVLALGQSQFYIRILHQIMLKIVGPVISYPRKSVVKRRCYKVPFLKFYLCFPKVTLQFLISMWIIQKAIVQ